jgi:hypothetical protein
MAERPRMTAADLVDKLLTSEHADVLRDSVAWLVAELMDAEVGELTGAELGERALTAARPSAMAIGRAAGTPGWVSSSWPSPSCGPAATSPVSWSRAGALNRRWSRWSRRPRSTASRPVRSTGWWNNSACAA